MAKSTAFNVMQETLGRGEHLTLNQQKRLMQFALSQQAQKERHHARIRQLEAQIRTMVDEELWTNRSSMAVELIENAALMGEKLSYRKAGLAVGCSHAAISTYLKRRNKRSGNQVTSRKEKNHG